jgi:hypothetical protein
MATFTATAAHATSPAIYAVNRDTTRVVVYSIGASASAGDVFLMARIPVGAVVTRTSVAIDGHSGVLTCNIGDGNDVSRYGASVVLSGSAVALTSIPSRGVGYAYTAEDTVDVQIGAISAPVAAGALKLTVTYTNQP